MLGIIIIIIIKNKTNNNCVHALLPKEVLLTIHEIVGHVRYFVMGTLVFFIKIFFLLLML